VPSYSYFTCSGNNWVSVICVLLMIMY
jgi:hypothetical protein